MASSVSHEQHAPEVCVSSSDLNIVMEAKSEPLENALESFIDVKQRIMLPKTYNTNSQIVKLRITMPRLIFVTPQDSEPNDEIITEEQEKIDDNKSSSAYEPPNQTYEMQSNPISEDVETAVLENSQIFVEPKNNLLVTESPQSIDEIFSNSQNTNEINPTNLDEVIDEDLPSESNPITTGNENKSHSIEIEDETGSSVDPDDVFLSEQDQFKEIPPLREKNKTQYRRTRSVESTKEPIPCYKRTISEDGQEASSNLDERSLTDDFRKYFYKKYISELTSASRCQNTSSAANKFDVKKEECLEKTSKPVYSNKRVNTSENLVKAKVKFFEMQFLPQNNLPVVEFPEIKPSTSRTIEEKVQEFFENHEYKNIEFRKFPFSTQGHPKSSFETFRKYLERLDKADETDDSEIIKKLVLERYKEALQNFIEKSARRKRISVVDEEYKQEKSIEWRDSGNNSICEEIIEYDEEKFLPCNASTSTSCGNLSNTTYTLDRRDSQEESSNDTFVKAEPEFNEEIFLDTALGSSNTIDSDSSRSRSVEEENSVGTSHISQLISGAYDLYSSIEFATKKNRQSINTYASIINSMESVKRSLESVEEIPESAKHVSFKTSAYPVEPIVTDETRISMEDLERALNQQTYIILQVSKALDLCSKIKKFYKSIERIEAEQILLAATVRKEIITEEMSRVEYDAANGDKNGQVRLSNISINLLGNYDSNMRYARYFVCLFRCGPILHSSGVLIPDEAMELKMNKSLYFEDLPSDFEIIVYLYSMCAQVGDNEDPASFKNCSHFFHNMKKLLSPKKRISESQTHNYTIKRPSFLLYGKSAITRASLQQNEFKIHTPYPRIPLASTLRCDIDSLTKLNNKLSGFMTIGENFKEIVIWNRQWCVLDASVIKFWDYPGRETEIAPSTVIDLSRSLLQSIQPVDKKLCSRPKTLFLEYGPESADEDFSVKQMYLSTDNQEDFLAWKTELNSVLTTLIQWGGMKPYFYISKM